MLQGTSIAMLTSAYPREKRGNVLGISMACIFFGQSIGPIVGGLLTEHLGWRSIFGVSIITGLTLVIITLWKIKTDWIEAKGASFDYKGASIYGVSLIAIIYGCSLIPQIQGIVIAIAGICGILLFIKIESGTSSPILDITLFRNNKAFVFANFSSVIMSLSTFATGFLLSLYLQYVKGFSPGKAGLIFLVLPVTQALLTPFAGKLSDRVEARFVATSGMTVTLMGLFLLIFIGANTSVFEICGILLVLGCGMALFNSPNTNAIMSSVTSKHYALAASFNNTMRTVGSTVSLTFVMIIFTFIIGQSSISSEVAPQFLTCLKIIFSVFSALSLLGVFTSLARSKRTQ